MGNSGHLMGSSTLWSHSGTQVAILSLIGISMVKVKAALPASHKPSSPLKEKERGGQAVSFIKDVIRQVNLPFMFTSHWKGVIQLVTPSCKEGWDFQPLTEQLCVQLKFRRFSYWTEENIKYWETLGHLCQTLALVFLQSWLYLQMPRESVDS